MLQLLESYSLSEIIIFFIVFCIAIKEAVTFYDWGKTRIQQGYNKNLAEKEDKDNIQNQIDEFKETFDEKEQKFTEKKKEINEAFGEMQQEIRTLSEKVNMLIDSDRDDIKAYITDKHHYFCYCKKWIDNYSLDCIEKRYKHYQDEKGNSFVEDLMVELRALPKRPPESK